MRHTLPKIRGFLATFYPITFPKITKRTEASFLTGRGGAFPVAAARPPRLVSGTNYCDVLLSALVWRVALVIWCMWIDCWNYLKVFFSFLLTAILWYSVPRRSLRPTVQQGASPFRWAKSTARATSPTQHVRPPGFYHCLFVRLEQSSGPCPQSEIHRSCFLATAKDIAVRTVLAHPAH